MSKRWRNVQRSRHFRDREDEYQRKRKTQPVERLTPYQLITQALDQLFEDLFEPLTHTHTENQTNDY